MVFHDMTGRFLNKARRHGIPLETFNKKIYAWNALSDITPYFFYRLTYYT